MAEEKKTKEKKPGLLRKKAKSEAPAPEKKESGRARRAVNSWLILVLALLCTVFVLLIFSHDPIKTETADYDTLSEHFATEGAFVLNETVIETNGEYTFYPLVQSGRRVRANSAVAYYVSPEYNETVIRIRELEERIETLKAQEPVHVTEADLQTLQREMEGRILAAGEALRAGRAEEAETLYNEVSLLAGHRYGLMSSLDESGNAVITALEDEKAALEAELSVQSYIYSPAAGQVSYWNDGLGTEVRAKDILDKSAGEIDSWFTKVKENSGSDPVENTIRVLDNHSWILVIAVDNEEYHILRDQKKARVTIGEEEFTFSILSVRGQGDDRYAFLETDDPCAAYLSGRYCADVQVAVAEYDGIAVKKSALVTVDGELGVYVDKISDYRFRPVTVLTENEEIAIVEGVNRWDEVVVNPQELGTLTREVPV